MTQTTYTLWSSRIISGGRNVPSHDASSTTNKVGSPRASNHISLNSSFTKLQHDKKIMAVMFVLIGCLHIFRNMSRSAEDSSSIVINHSTPFSSQSRFALFIPLRSHLLIFNYLRIFGSTSCPSGTDLQSLLCSSLQTKKPNQPIASLPKKVSNQQSTFSILRHRNHQQQRHQLNEIL